MKSGSLNLLEPLGPVQAFSVIALSLLNNIKFLRTIGHKSLPRKEEQCSLLFMKPELLNLRILLCAFLYMLLETSCGWNIIDIYIRCRFIL